MLGPPVVIVSEAKDRVSRGESAELVKLGLGEDMSCAHGSGTYPPERTRPPVPLPDKALALFSADYYRQA